MSERGWMFSLELYSVWMDHMRATTGARGPQMEAMSRLFDLIVVGQT